MFDRENKKLKQQKKIIPRQSLKRFTFRVKLSDSIFFLLGLSPIFKLIWHEKQIFLSILRGKYYLNDLENVKRPKKRNYNVEILF